MSKRELQVKLSELKLDTRWRIADLIRFSPKLQQKCKRKVVSIHVKRCEGRDEEEAEEPLQEAEADAVCSRGRSH